MGIGVKVRQYPYSLRGRSSRMPARLRLCCGDTDLSPISQGAARWRLRSTGCRLRCARIRRCGRSMLVRRCSVRATEASPCSRSSTAGCASSATPATGRSCCIRRAPARCSPKPRCSRASTIAMRWRQSNSRVRAYPKRALLAAFRDQPDLAERFMAVLAHEIQALRARLEERNIRSARERVLHHLALDRQAGRRDGDAGRHADGPRRRDRPQPRSALSRPRRARRGGHDPAHAVGDRPVCTVRGMIRIIYDGRSPA